MAEDKTAPATSEAPQFVIERIYLKDASLETPAGLEAFGVWQPQITLDVNTRQHKVDEQLHEVVLRLTVTARPKDSEKIYFLIEIEQAGLFAVRHIPDTELPRLLATLAPATLFPYAREAIDGLAVKANFPPLRLAPINFEALWQSAQTRQPSSQRVQ